MKKYLLILPFLFFPFSTLAACDFSVGNIQRLSQRYLDANYAYKNFGLAKPRLIVSNRRVHDYYAEELHGTITVFAKEFNDSYCDQYFDGLTPFLQRVVNHEYMHYLDEKLHLSRQIKERAMSENTAIIGEHALKDLRWSTSYTKRELRPSEAVKYEKLLNILR